MTPSLTSRTVRALLIAVGLTLAIPMLGSAQGGPGFLFKKPTITLKLETGYGIQSAGSEIFDFVVDSFSHRGGAVPVGRRDFDGPYFGGEVAYRATERLDLALGVGLTQASIDSEFTYWEDLDGSGIEQVIRLRVVPITLSAKYYFNDRGRTVGQFAWVPNRLNPYVGGGVGLVAYDFSMKGDFVDSVTFDVFYDELSSLGQSALARGLAGVSLSLGRQFELSTELRYTLSSADMGLAFEGFEPLDLNGFQGVVGIAVRF